MLRDFWQRRDDPTKTVLILLGIFALGLALRLYGLAGYPPYIDEYIHTSDAVDLYVNHNFEWNRAYLTVTLPIYLSYLIFGVSLWASRLPMVIINMLAIFPLFALGKKIDQKLGYLAVGLFVLNPWAIAAARPARDYAIVPAFFYLATVLLIDLFDWDGQTLRQYLIKYKFQIVILALVLGYVLFDHQSVLKITLALYGIFGLLAVLKALKQKPSLKMMIVVLVASTLLVVLLAENSDVISRYLRTGRLLGGMAAEVARSSELEDSSRSTPSRLSTPALTSLDRKRAL